MDNHENAPQIVQPAPGLAEMPATEPSSIKVFGILHLVFGGFGVLMLLASSAQLIFRKAMVNASSQGDDALTEFQNQFAESSQTATAISLLASLIVTIFILRAGLLLVQRKKNAVKASVLYSYISLGAKIIAILLALLVTMPALNTTLETLGGDTNPQMKALAQTMKITLTTSAILGPVVMCLYPILSLVLLKKKAVGEYLAQHGK